MAATSSILPSQFPGAPPGLYPEHFKMFNPTEAASAAAAAGYLAGAFKDAGNVPYPYQFQPSGNSPAFPLDAGAAPPQPGPWSFGTAISGIVPEPERFGDLCEQGLVSIITTATCDVITSETSSSSASGGCTIKRPLVAPPPLSCQPTFVTTSQPLMCHSALPLVCGPGGLPEPDQFPPYTNQPEPHLDSYANALEGWHASDIDPFYSNPPMTGISGPGNSSGVLPSPWDYYRTSTT